MNELHALEDYCFFFQKLPSLMNLELENVVIFKSKGKSKCFISKNNQPVLFFSSFTWGQLNY